MPPSDLETQHRLSLYDDLVTLACIALDGYAGSTSLCSVYSVLYAHQSRMRRVGYVPPSEGREEDMETHSKAVAQAQEWCARADPPEFSAEPEPEQRAALKEYICEEVHRVTVTLARWALDTGGGADRLQLVLLIYLRADLERRQVHQEQLVGLEDALGARVLMEVAQELLDSLTPCPHKTDLVMPEVSEYEDAHVPRGSLVEIAFDLGDGDGEAEIVLCVVHTVRRGQLHVTLVDETSSCTTTGYAKGTKIPLDPRYIWDAHVPAERTH